MKRAQRWSVDSEEGPGHRRSQAGPFRRRRALRHLDSLAQHPARELSETVGVAHVRVIGEGSAPAPVSVPLAALVETDQEGPGPIGQRGRNASDRFYAVPIDEELGVSLLPAIQQR